LRVGKLKPLSRHKTRHGQHVAEMSISVPLVEGVVLALDRIGEHHECVFRHLYPPSRVLSQRDELTPLAPCGILLPGSPEDGELLRTSGTMRRQTAPAGASR